MWGEEPEQRTIHQQVSSPLVEEYKRRELDVLERKRERKRKKCVNTRCKMGQTHSNPTCFSSLLVADTGDTDRVRMIVVVPFPEKEGYAESDAIATPRRLYIMGGETVT